MLTKLRQMPWYYAGIACMLIAIALFLSTFWIGQSGIWFGLSAVCFEYACFRMSDKKKEWRNGS